MKDDKMDNVTLRIDCVNGEVVVYRDRAQVAALSGYEPDDQEDDGDFEADGVGHALDRILNEEP